MDHTQPTQPYQLTSMYSWGQGQSSSVRSLNLIFGFQVESTENSSCRYDPIYCMSKKLHYARVDSYTKWIHSCCYLDHYDGKTRRI